MKCDMCNGSGEIPIVECGFPGKGECPQCHGKGYLTNKEYMRTCSDDESDDELVALLCELVDSGILQEWRIKYRCADSDEDAVRMWLKEEHKE